MNDNKDVDSIFSVLICKSSVVLLPLVQEVAMFILLVSIGVDKSIAVIVHLSFLMYFFCENYHSCFVLSILFCLI